MNITGLIPGEITAQKVLTVCVTWANHEAPKTPKYMSDLIKQTEESVEVLKKTVAGVGQQLEEMKPLKAETYLVKAMLKGCAQSAMLARHWMPITQNTALKPTSY